MTIKPLIIANWKMNLSLTERTVLALEVKDSMGSIDTVDIVLCPSFVSLTTVQNIITDSKLHLGSQDVFWEKSGAYTGEESPAVLYELGCRYALVGHSERRQHLGETSEMVHKKVERCLEHRLTPVVCVGETFEQRQRGQTDNVIYEQISKALSGIVLTDHDQLVIAYEPVWVIGSGQAIDVYEASQVFQVIYQTLVDSIPPTILKNNVRIIYGGSVDAHNTQEFLDIEHCSGLLIGGASLKAQTFNEIVTITSHAYSS
jgi:triosephosphate isomerase